MDSDKTRFNQIYVNLPLEQRKQIVVVIDTEELSWNAAKIEIDSDSEKGKRIIEILKKLDILK